MARKALVVVNDEYLDPGLPRLFGRAQEAAALTDVLGDEAIGGFAVAVVRNARLLDLRERMDAFFSAANREDELLVHFSCYGLAEGGTYLAATDTRPSSLAATGLPVGFVAQRMRVCRASSIALILDCCHGRGDVPAVDSLRQEQWGTGRVVVAARYGVEGGDQGSAFLSAVVEGIVSGNAATDASGTISARDLLTYAERQVDPRPSSFGDGGNFVVARSPLRRIVASTLPESVQAALTGDRMSRLGAVRVLSDLVDRADPSTALAAVQALQGLVNDESRSLSEAARDTLHRIRLTADPKAVEVPAGTPTRAEVVLGGSALAIGARVESSPEWIHVRQVGDRLRLTVDARDAAEAYLQASGPTGSVDIRVTALAPANPDDRPQPGPHDNAGRDGGGEAVVAVGNGTRSGQERRSADGGGLKQRSGPATSTVNRLWAAAAILQLMLLFVPLDADGYRLVGGAETGDDLARWLLVLLAAAGMLLAAILSYRPSSADQAGGLVAGVLGVVLSVFCAVGVVAIWGSDGAAVADLVAVVAALVGIVALVLMIRRRTAPPGEPDRRGVDQRDLRRPVS